MQTQGGLKEQAKPWGGSTETGQTWSKAGRSQHLQTCLLITDWWFHTLGFLKSVSCYSAFLLLSTKIYEQEKIYLYLNIPENKTNMEYQLPGTNKTLWPVYFLDPKDSRESWNHSLDFWLSVTVEDIVPLLNLIRVQSVCSAAEETRQGDRWSRPACALSHAGRRAGRGRKKVWGQKWEVTCRPCVRDCEGDKTVGFFL